MFSKVFCLFLTLLCSWTQCLSSKYQCNNPEQSIVIFYEKASLTAETLAFLGNSNLKAVFVINPDWATDNLIKNFLQNALKSGHDIGFFMDTTLKDHPHDTFVIEDSLHQSQKKIAQSIGYSPRIVYLADSTDTILPAKSQTDSQLLAFIATTEFISIGTAYGQDENRVQSGCCNVARFYANVIDMLTYTNNYNATLFEFPVLLKRNGAVTETLDHIVTVVDYLKSSFNRSFVDAKTCFGIVDKPVSSTSSSTIENTSTTTSDPQINPTTSTTSDVQQVDTGKGASLSTIWANTFSIVALLIASLWIFAL